MKIQKFQFETIEMIQIYITKEEKKDEKVLEKINQIKKQNSNVSIWISGEMEIANILKEILNYQKSKNL